MTNCPCGSNRTLDDCCGQIIAGAPAPTAEALMRSRYTAVTQGRIDHLDATHAPEAREDFDKDQTQAMATDATWNGLEVRRVEGGTASDQTGTVEFVARFLLRGKQFAHHELASFRREAGQWVYVDGQMNPKQPPRRVEKVGRNDPCPCGSGKKHKKCCGA